MIKSRIAAAAALLVVAGAASAGASVTATWVSDYDWRGVTQSGQNGAFQLGGTYTADSGVYAGLWGSTLSTGATEIDEFVGFSGGDMIGYDVGVNYYSYPNNKDWNFGELYAGISHGPVGLKVWWSPDFGGKGTAGHTSAFYVEGNGTFPIPAMEGVSFLAHVGYSDGDGIRDYYGAGQKHYMDWNAGFGYDIGNFNTFVKYVDGSNNDALGDFGSRFLFGISTTLPWGK
jgi:uncharacterized protein (TIGR02001 family)